MSIKRTTLERIIERLIDAEIAHDFRGAQHPDDWPPIVKELAAARKALKLALDKLTELK